MYKYNFYIFNFLKSADKNISVQCEYRNAIYCNLSTIVEQ